MASEPDARPTGVSQVNMSDVLCLTRHRFLFSSFASSQSRPCDAQKSPQLVGNMSEKSMSAEQAESSVQTLPFLTSPQLAVSHGPKRPVGAGVGFGAVIDNVGAPDGSATSSSGRPGAFGPLDLRQWMRFGCAASTSCRQGEGAWSWRSRNPNRSLQKETSRTHHGQGCPSANTPNAQASAPRPRSSLGLGAVTPGFMVLGLVFRPGTTFGSGAPAHGREGKEKLAEEAGTVTPAPPPHTHDFCLCL